MTKTTLRNLQRAIARRRRREGMTLIEIMIVVIIIALIATGAAVLALPALERSRIRQAQTDGEAVRNAVQMYLAENAGGDCPSVEDLQQGYLDGSKRTTDPWDNPFIIECDGDDVVVISNGPDGNPNTEDDIQ